MKVRLIQIDKYATGACIVLLKHTQKSIRKKRLSAMPE